MDDRKKHKEGGVGWHREFSLTVRKRRLALSAGGRTGAAGFRATGLSAELQEGVP